MKNGHAMVTAVQTLMMTVEASVSLQNSYYYRTRNGKKLIVSQTFFSVTHHNRVRKELLIKSGSGVV